ncbi:Cro/CI family transcriptional regulator, partial [Klebsiella michiganensis]|uniref:Cro/CI family transcriptional regulator n=1 Tax=Klebsiella michiganensis TaxID=1134687 RepID=UPI001D0D4652
MYKSDALSFFGTKTRLAKAAGVRLSSIYKWGELVPEGRAARLQAALSSRCRLSTLAFS